MGCSGLRSLPSPPRKCLPRDSQGWQVVSHEAVNIFFSSLGTEAKTRERSLQMSSESCAIDTAVMTRVNRSLSNVGVGCKETNSGLNSSFQEAEVG